MPFPSTSLDELVIRPARDADAAAVVMLFERAFDRTITEAHWRWKLGSHADPMENVVVAQLGERIVGHYGALPLPARVAGRDGTIAVALDAMVDPDYRRRGILTAMVTDAHPRWARGGAAMVLALPNEQWGSRIEAAGYVTLFPQSWLVRPLRPLAWLGRRRPPFRMLAPLDPLPQRLIDLRLRRDPKISVREVDEPDASLDQFWQRLAPHHAFSIRRDRGWVAWRYLASPELKYRVLVARRGGEPVGFAAYRLRHDPERTLGLIAEVTTLPADDAARDTLLAALLTRFYADGVELAATLALPESPLYRAARRAGFRLTWGDFTVRAVPLEPELEHERLRDPHAWLIGGGDFDAL